LKRFCYLLFVFIIHIYLSGCLGTRYLQEDEYLIYNQKIKGNEETSKEKLAEFYKQNKNRRIPILNLSPWVYFYQWGMKSFEPEKLNQKKQLTIEKYDRKIEEYKNEKPKKAGRTTDRKTKKLDKIDKTLNEGNFLMRLGEPLAIYDNILADATLEQINTYLNTQGFFDANAQLHLRYEDKLVFVKYIIEEGRPHLIDTILYSTGDKNIDSLVHSTGEESFLSVGDRYNQENLTDERARIESLLQNNGYYGFSRQYITYLVDTTLGDYKMAIELKILKPSENANHKIYTIDSVIFTTDVTSTSRNLKRFYEVYNGITYKYVKDNFSKKILDRRVFQYPGQRYSRQNMQETQRQLLNLDNFKFVNINYDTLGNRFITNIFTSPLKKYQMTNEAGVNVTEGLPGPFYNITLTSRNIFKGLENLEISGTIGYEGVASATDRSKVYTSLEAGAFLSLTFPQFLLPISNTRKSRFGQYNPKTTFSAGFAFTDRNEYKRAGFNTFINYSWQKNLEKLFNVRIADISLIRSTINDPAFQDALDDIRERGNNFWRTFEPSLVLSTRFSKTRNFNQYTSYLSRQAAFLKYTIEAGGTVLNFFDINYADTSGLELYKFVKFVVDYRKYQSVSPKTKIAYRLRAGIASSYAENKVLPYEKYLFIGGSNSNRAWRPRRLGPGSFANIDTVYSDTGTTLHYNDNFEQPGEILLEANFELRMQVIGFFHTALFVDAGNIWTLRKDTQRPGAEFKLDRFYKEIAIGAGIGGRFDFTFLLLRLDMGFRIYDPSLPPGYKWFTKYNTEKINGIDKLIFNLAIGYPF
jgi:hypothetical protein